MPTELKPCPFCGGIPEIIVRRDDNKLEHLFCYSVGIKCPSCGCNTGANLVENDVEQEVAIARLSARWNKRVPLDIRKITYCRDCTFLNPRTCVCERPREGLVSRYPEDFCSRGIPKITG